jgi:hypothetical protein
VIAFLLADLVDEIDQTVALIHSTLIQFLPTNLPYRSCRLANMTPIADLKPVFNSGHVSRFNHHLPPDPSTAISTSPLDLSCNYPTSRSQ